MVKSELYVIKSDCTLFYYFLFFSRYLLLPIIYPNMCRSGKEERTPCIKISFVLSFLFFFVFFLFSTLSPLLIFLTTLAHVYNTIFCTSVRSDDKVGEPNLT